MANKGKEIAQPATWEKEIKYLFCDLCIREIDLGNRPHGYLSKEGWENVVKGFAETTGRTYERSQLKNKWDQLKKDWKTWNDLKNGCTGLGWNPEKRTIDASEEWWAQRLLVFPNAKKFKVIGIEPELEERMDRMFKGTVATGKFACAPSEVGFTETQEPVAVSLSDDSPILPSIGQTDIQSTNRSKRPRFEGKKKRGAASYRAQLSYLVESSNDAPHRVQRTSVNDVVSLLDEHEDIALDDDLYYFAVELLQDSVHRDFFMAISKQRRVKYLRHFYYRRNM